MKAQKRHHAYTLQQLAGLYGISVRTLNRWLKPFSEEIGKRNGHFYNIRQIEIIFSHLGDPLSEQENSR